MQAIIDMVQDKDVDHITFEVLEAVVEHLGNVAALKKMNEERGPMYDQLCVALDIVSQSLPSHLSQWKLVEEVGATLLEAKTTLSRPEGELADIKFTQEHAALACLNEKVAEFPTVEALVGSDVNDQLARQLLESSRRCSELATSKKCSAPLIDHQQLQKARKQGWDMLHEIVKFKQRSVDKDLLAKAEALSQIAGGMSEGRSWKETLEGRSNVTWDILTRVAKETLFVDEKGNVLQQAFKALSEVRSLCTERGTKY